MFPFFLAPTTLFFSLAAQVPDGACRLRSTPGLCLSFRVGRARPVHTAAVRHTHTQSYFTSLNFPCTQLLTLWAFFICPEITITIGLHSWQCHCFTAVSRKVIFSTSNTVLLVCTSTQPQECLFKVIPPAWWPKSKTILIFSHSEQDVNFCLLQHQGSA